MAILDNRTSFSLTETRLRLDELICCAGLENYKLLVVLWHGDFEEPFRWDDPKNLGMCVPRALFPRFYRNVEAFDHHFENDWECGVVLAGSVSEKFEEYPAYFTYILGHELGHVLIFRDDFWLYVLCGLFFQGIREIEERIAHELPDEGVCDRFGKHLAVSLYGIEKFNLEINSLLNNPNPKDPKRLRFLLESKEISSIDTYELRQPHCCKNCVV